MFIKHVVRNIPWISCPISSSVGHHSSLSGTTSNLNGVSTCEMISLRLYFLIKGNGRLKLSWFSIGWPRFAAFFPFWFGFRVLRFCWEWDAVGRPEPVATVAIWFEDRPPFWAATSAFWKLAALKSSKESGLSVSIYSAIYVRDSKELKEPLEPC